MQAKIVKPNVQVPDQFDQNIVYYGLPTGRLCRVKYNPDIKENPEIQYFGEHKDRMPIDCIVVSEKYIYSGSWDKRILRYDRQTLQLDSNLFFVDQESNSQTLESHTDSVKSLMLSNKYLYSGSANGFVSKWDLTQNGEIYPIISRQICTRFITSIIQFQDNILISSSNKQIFIVDQELNIIKSCKLDNITTISQLYLQPSGIYAMGRDIFQLDFDLELQKIYLLKTEPYGLLFTQNCILATTRFGCYKIPYQQYQKPDYYKQLQKDADKITIEQMKIIRDIENKQKDKYEQIAIGITDIPCGINIVSQIIKLDDKQRKCYMILTGCHDGTIKRTFYNNEDREFFFPKNDDGEESLDINMDDSSDDSGYEELGKMLNNQDFKAKFN